MNFKLGQDGMQLLECLFSVDVNSAEGLVMMLRMTSPREGVVRVASKNVHVPIEG